MTKKISTPKTKKAFEAIITDIYRKSATYKLFLENYAVLLGEDVELIGKFTPMALPKKINDAKLIKKIKQLEKQSMKELDEAFPLESLGEKYGLSYDTLRTYGANFFNVNRVLIEGKSKLCFQRNISAIKNIAMLDSVIKDNPHLKILQG